MELCDFKTQIMNNSLSNTFVIAKCAGNGDFVFHQYLNKYATDNQLSIEYLEDINEVYALTNTNLFGVAPTVIYVVYVDNLSKQINIPIVNNLWIRTKKIDKHFYDEYAEYIIDIPKLEQWQIKDYMLSTTSLSESIVDELIAVYKDNIYRIDLELEKIKLSTDHTSTYNLIKDQLYVDSTHYVIFDLINSIIRKDTNSLSNLLINLDKIDVDSFGMLKLLLDNFKNVINIQLNPRATAENLNMSSKQFWAIKKFSCGHYTKEQLTNIYKFLTDCDYKVKSGQLDTNMMIDYFITKILTL